MDEKNQEILRQYNFKTYNIYRIRGAHILETNEGPKLFKRLECSKNRVEFEDRIHMFLVNKGHPYVDLYVRNVHDEIVTSNSMGNCYIVKNWNPGVECNLRNEEEIMAGVGNLAFLHTLLKEVPMEKEQVIFNSDVNLKETFEKRNRELRKVRSYIRGKRKKNEFELCFMSCYDRLFEQAREATNLLEESKYDVLFNQVINNRHVCHGNYNYHNVIMLKGNQSGKETNTYKRTEELVAADLNTSFLKHRVLTTNFEKAVFGIHITDLYHFIRKAMEKNDWKLNIGIDMIETYESICGISPDEKQLLYILLLYPEKFWKVSNYYFNGKKTWVPKKNIQKLMDIKNQIDEKDIFLKCLKESLS
jgi:hypothetical protein